MNRPEAAFTASGQKTCCLRFLFRSLFVSLSVQPGPVYETNTLVGI